MSKMEGGGPKRVQKVGGVPKISKSWLFGVPKKWKNAKTWWIPTKSEKIDFFDIFDHFWRFLEGSELGQAAGNVFFDPFFDPPSFSFFSYFPSTLTPKSRRKGHFGPHFKSWKKVIFSSKFRQKSVSSCDFKKCEILCAQVRSNFLSVLVGTGRL